MAGLLDHIRRRIAQDGPLSVAEYMSLCLGHPEYGYYMTRDPLGRAGDFITAPEISQMFGELIGLWAAQLWHDLGRPAPFKWIELGPGRGTLAADALRAMRGVPGLPTALEVHLVETSPVLRQRQGLALPDWAPIWHDAVADVPQGPAVIIANEFFDALPVRQYQRESDGWHERVVTLADDGALGFVATPRLGIAPLLPPGLARARPGDVVEASPAAVGIARALADRLVRDGGAALIVDYGHGASVPGDTLQAVRGHAFCDVLAAPGEADLTAHVDFAALAAAAHGAGAAVFGPVAQGDFLKSLGIEVRAARLKAAAGASEGAAIESALRRLTAADAMGRLFKAMALSAPGQTPPAGFEV